MSVLSKSIVKMLLSTISVVICSSQSIAHAQDARPFSEDAERSLRSGIESFSQSPRQQRINNDLFEDTVTSPFESNRDIRSEARNGINTRDGLSQFSEDLFETNQNRDSGLEGRGGQRTSFELDVERADRRREQRLEETMRVRGGDQPEGRGQRGRPQRDGGGDNQDQEIGIDNNDINELEGRDGRLADENGVDARGGIEGENGGNSFEEDFLRAEQELEQGQQGDQVANAQLRGRGALRRNGRQNNAQRRQDDGELEADPNDITGSIRPNAPEEIYAQEGKRVGSFLFFPEITISGIYSDNPSAAPANRPGDYAFEFVPRFLLRSDWARHGLEFEGQLTKSYFAELTSENVEEWFVRSSARIDIQDNHYFQLEGRIDNLQDDRGEIDNLNTDAELASFQTLNLNGVYNYGWNRSTLQVTGALTEYDYDDVTNSQGVVTNNDDRDYLESSASVRLNHTFHPGFSVFSASDYVSRDFDSRLDDQGFQRGANGYGFSLGGIYDLSSLWRLEASVGHEWLDADEARYVDIKEIVYNAALTYRASEKTTLVLSTARDVESTDLDGTIGVVETNYSAILTHYFRSHIRFVGSFVYEEEEFAGVDAEQNTLTLGASLQYILNNKARVLASYEFSDVDTNDGAGYQENVFRIGLNLRP